MNSRRFMCSPQAKDHTLPHRWKRRVVHHRILAHATSATGQVLPMWTTRPRVRSTSTTGLLRVRDYRSFVPNGLMHRSKTASSLDHLVGEFPSLPKPPARVGLERALRNSPERAISHAAQPCLAAPVHATHAHGQPLGRLDALYMPAQFL
jgi:hypothetical protein